MKAAGSNRNYKQGPKNNWRRTIWNEVLRRTSGAEKDLPILYLAGPQDLDRDVAVSKGVPIRNLIAIDRDQRNVDRIRETRSPAVSGDALDVLWSWPGNRKVAAVLLDFCCGLESGVISAYDAFEREPLRNAVVMVNFMRGRDPWSNETRGLLEAFEVIEPPRGVDVDGGSKNRAWQFVLFHAIDGFATLAGGGSSKSGPDGRAHFPMPAPGRSRDLMRMVVNGIVSQMAPRFFSYSSGNLRFDSVVLQHPARHLDSPLVPAAARAAWRTETSEREGRYRVLGVARKIAAMLAVRTMRAGA